MDASRTAAGAEHARHGRLSRRRQHPNLMDPLSGAAHRAASGATLQACDNADRFSIVSSALADHARRGMRCRQNRAHRRSCGTGGDNQRGGFGPPWADSPASICRPSPPRGTRRPCASLAPGELGHERQVQRLEHRNPGLHLAPFPPLDTHPAPHRELRVELVPALLHPEEELAVVGVVVRHLVTREHAGQVLTVVTLGAQHAPRQVLPRIEDGLGLKRREESALRREYSEAPCP